MEQDYDIGSTIRDKIIPHAVSWFTGKAVEEDEFDGLEEEDDDDEDDDEEMDDEYEEGDDDVTTMVALDMEVDLLNRKSMSTRCLQSQQDIDAIAGARAEIDAENNQPTTFPNGEKAVHTYRSHAEPTSTHPSKVGDNDEVPDTFDVKLVKIALLYMFCIY
ncbi:nucleosome assembly protein 1;2 [Tanacetum coccineum]